MNRIAWFVSVLAVAAGLDASHLDAQSFAGTGQEATKLFPLPAGLTVFQLEHQGEGPFTVRLLDERGTLVEELARVTGPFRGSKAVGIPQSGRYLLDVNATGRWAVHLREEVVAVSVAPTDAALPDTASPDYRAAAAAAREVRTGAWLARGFVGGALGGPIGAAIAVGFADRSGVSSAGVADGGEPGPGFDAAYTRLVRDARKKKAFVGGMLGSAVFLGGLVWAIQIAHGGEGGGGGSTDPGGGQFILVPR